MKRLLSLLFCLIIILSAFPAIGSEAAFEGDDKIVIVLDPGHGGASVGTSRNGIGEKVYTFRLANLLKERLEANGNFIVHMTRTGDYDLPLAKRGMIANELNADVLVSLHFDGSTYYDRGVSVITSVLPEYAMRDLAGLVCSKFSAATGIPIKGIIQKKDTAGYYWNSERQWDVKDPSLGVLSDYYGIPTWCAKFGIKSILIEHGFFTNSADAAFIFSEGGLETIADADAAALIEYYTNHTHSYNGNVTRDFPSNCMFVGKQSEHCTVCGHRRNITSLASDPDNHYWINEKSQNAQCGVDGYISRECRITENLNDKDVPCENHVESITLAATPHDYKLVETRAVEHAVDGYYKYTCSNCNNTYKEPIKAEGHTWSFLEHTDATCTADGYDKYSCSGCSDIRTDVISAKGHSVRLSDERAATCTEAGYKKTECTVCGEVFEEAYAALGHMELREIISECSCTERGEVHITCERCDYDVSEITEPTGHSFEKVSETEAKCLKNGEMEYKCSACSETKTEMIAAFGHNYTEAVKKEKSFFVRGVREFVCNNCSESYEEEIASTWDRTEVKILLIGGTVLVVTMIVLGIWFFIHFRNKLPEKVLAEEESESEESESEESEAELEDADEDGAEAEKEEIEAAENESEEMTV